MGKVEAEEVKKERRLKLVLAENLTGNEVEWVTGPARK